MKIALVHNTYQWPGGEDVIVNQELELLRSAGSGRPKLIAFESLYSMGGNVAPIGCIGEYDDPVVARGVCGDVLEQREGAV